MQEHPETVFDTIGYELGRLVATDHWGELYEARYRPHDRAVLLRRLPAGLASDEGAWGLMQAEVQVWARVDHPAVLQVLDWGRCGGEAFFATAMPDGRLLSHALAADGALSRAEGALADVAGALEACRQWGVLHLGLHPGCVWLQADGGAAVGDFGLWYVTREFPRFGQRRDAYLAPEQRDGDGVSAATDCYALAVLAVSCWCGEQAATGWAAGGPLPELPIERQAPLRRCLDVQPPARYRTPGALAAALGINVPDEPRDAHRDCPLCRLKEQIEQEAGAGERHSGSPARSYAWLITVALAALAVMVWWMALR